MVDDEVHRAERVDLGGVATEALHSITHGSEIDDGWNTPKKSAVLVRLNLVLQ